ncbi:MAG: hypothetical protein PVI30_08100 [Myxococcales bacterium]|jgi:hypothetical protein
MNARFLSSMVSPALPTAAVLTSVLLAVLIATSGCGDDADADAGPDASMDGGDDDNGGTIRRRDGQTVSGDAVPECDRSNPSSCGAGETCKVVIRRAPGEDQFVIYAGCVEQQRARGADAPCEQFGGLGDPYEVDGLTDEVYVDPCGEGLYCAPDRGARGSFRCQTACDTNFGVACTGPGEYCLGQGAFEEVCVDSDGCDPRDPTSCGEGRGCYLRFNDTGEAVLSVCLPEPEEPVADGEPCEFLNDCEPGSSCWAPVRKPPSRWEAGDVICRRSCDPGVEDDAGQDEGTAGDEDAGVSGGGCPGTLACEDFAESGLDISTVSVGFGQCE